MRIERPTCRECACSKVCEYFENENERNLDEVCPLLYWENYFVPKQEWISVEERLPYAGEDVLVLCDGLMRIDFIGSSGAWYEHDPKRITHWMPLPEAPKMKGGAE